MSQSGEERVDERLGDDSAQAEDFAHDEEAGEVGDPEELGDDEVIDTADFEDGLEAADEDEDVVDAELSQKEQNARSLAVRRAIEQRLERKRLEEDLDYLDLDPDD